MFKNFFKIMMLIILMIGTLITVSSNSWLSCWMGMEMNLISFIPMMIYNKNILSIEASLIYFITQALASVILLFSMLIYIMKNMFYFLFFNLMMNLLIMALMMKLGSAPLHYWLPMVMEGLNWLNNLILMTWQKIAPIILIFYCLNLNLIIIIIFIFFSTIIGGLGGFNQTSLRKIMAFSSINHIGWLLSSLTMSLILFKMYFLFYLMITFMLIMMFNLLKIFFLNQLFFINMMNLKMKFIMFLNLLSLGGLPPFLGFFPKMMIIQNFMMYNMFMLIIMIIFTMITLYYYMRIMYSSFMLNFMQLKLKLFYLNFNSLNFNILIKISYLSNLLLLMLMMIYYY